VRWRNKQATGFQKVPYYKVRWFDADADKPTDDYWKKFWDEDVHPDWFDARAHWKEAEELRKKGAEVTILIDLDVQEDFDPLPIAGEGFMCYRPLNWSSHEDWITVCGQPLPMHTFTSPKARYGGFAPRIHIFWTPVPEVSATEQVTWLKSIISRFTNRIDYEEDETPRMVGDGLWDCQFITVSHLPDGRVLKCLRKIMVRKDRTYFVFCYAHEDDWEVRFRTYRDFLAKLELAEQKK
jgi:hypothetical protein